MEKVVVQDRGLRGVLGYDFHCGRSRAVSEECARRGGHISNLHRGFGPNRAMVLKGNFPDG